MANYNKVIMLGNMTRDPKLSYLPNQTPVVELGIAVNRKFKDKEEVCYLDCVAYGKPAEIIAQYVTKGNPILLEGRLQFQSWEDKQGQKRSKIRMVVEQFQFISDKSSQGQNTSPPARQQPQTRGTGQGGHAAQQGYNAPSQAPQDYDDNIPF